MGAGASSGVNHTIGAKSFFGAGFSFHSRLKAVLLLSTVPHSISLATHPLVDILAQERAMPELARFFGSEPRTGFR